MTESVLPTDRVLELATRYFDAELPPLEEAELAAKLAACAENRRAFVDVCLHSKLISESLRNRLLESVAKLGPAPNAKSAALALLAKDGSPPASAPAAGPPLSSRSPLLGFLGNSLFGIPGEMIVGMLVIFAVLAATWGLTQLRQQRGRRDGAAGDFLATLTVCDGCQWSEAGCSPQRADRLAAGSLELLAGIAEITFDDGAHVIVEGPARLRLEAAGRAYLEYGRLVAHVPTPAKGFTVTSPSVTVVDLGTEFGLHVDAAGTADLEVFQGEVSAAPAANSKTAPIVLKMASAARFDRVSGKVRVPKSLKQSFVRQVDRKPAARATIVFMEEGGEIEAGNLATRRTSVAFAQDTLPGYPIHRVENLIDGQYGNAHSWVSAPNGRPFAGVRFGGLCRIDSLAFGRDNTVRADGDGFRDRWEGNYTLQYTTAKNPDERTPDDKWITIDTVNYRSTMSEIASDRMHPYLRHRFGFRPVVASAVRLLISPPGIGIDELEVYGAPLGD